MCFIYISHLISLHNLLKCFVKASVELLRCAIKPSRKTFTRIPVALKPQPCLCNSIIFPVTKHPLVFPHNIIETANIQFVNVNLIRNRRVIKFLMLCRKQLR